MSQKNHKYSNGEVTIVWKPELCIHSGNCFRGLPDVFKPGERPWVTPEGSTTEKIIGQVKKCPSGALSYFMNSEESAREENT
ncbi:MAG TPA: (4Fe-4S)-binding protein [Chitinophagaceae bacterium]|nr:(4Fe-4S)-binding protein [Chitinophagaceae bacterium]